MTSRVVSVFAAEEERRVLGLKPVLAPVHGRYGEHPHQSYDAWFSGTAGAPLVVLLHGGYWRYDRMHLTPFAAWLSQQGFDVLLPGFRRSGGAGGYPETFDDVARIVDTLPQGRPYVLAGHCSGGHLALWCAARGLLPPGSRWHTRTLPGGVLALAPITDLTATRRDGLSDDAALQLLGGERHFTARLPEVDPLTLLRNAGTTGVPTVLLHGAADEEVPLTQFSDYAAVHRDLQTVVLPGTGHYTLIEPGAPGARAVADTLRAMTAALPPQGTVQAAEAGTDGRTAEEGTDGRMAEEGTDGRMAEEGTGGRMAEAGTGRTVEAGAGQAAEEGTGGRTAMEGAGWTVEAGTGWTAEAGAGQAAEEGTGGRTVEEGTGRTVEEGTGWTVEAGTGQAVEAGTGWTIKEERAAHR